MASGVAKRTAFNPLFTKTFGYLPGPPPRSSTVFASFFLSRQRLTISVYVCFWCGSHCIHECRYIIGLPSSGFFSFNYLGKLKPCAQFIQGMWKVAAYIIIASIYEERARPVSYYISFSFSTYPIVHSASSTIYRARSSAPSSRANEGISFFSMRDENSLVFNADPRSIISVSYTHLTLPTIYSV